MREAFYGILIPFLGTSLGAACVFFMKKTLSDTVQRALTGFAAGVMVAASVWSLLIPAIEQSVGMGKFAFVPAVVGFYVGMLFLLLLDHVIPHLHQNSSEAEGPKSQLARTTMMVLAVTLHNIPEGMAVGVVYAGYLSGQAQITAAGALALSLGIAAPRGRHGQGTRIRRRRAFRHRRTHRRGADHSRRENDCARSAVSAQLCRGRNALCRCRRTDSRNVAGQTLQYRHNLLCAGLWAYDGA